MEDRLADRKTTPAGSIVRGSLQVGEREGRKVVRYESWRISFQSSEHAARAAYAEAERLRAELEKEKEISSGWSDLARRYMLDAERAGVRYEVRFPKQGARGG